MTFIKLTRKALTLFSVALLGSMASIPTFPVQAMEIDTHSAGNHLVIRDVMVVLEFHNMADHSKDMKADKAVQPVGINRNHMISVQLLDSKTKQALPNADVKVTITGPDKKQIGSAGTELKWVAPTARSPYYGAGFDLNYRGKHRIVINYKQGGKSSNVAFEVMLT